MIAAGCGGSVCEEGTFETGDTCAPVSACAIDQYETAPPSATSDRACAAVTACTSDEYETTAPTATSDRQCAPMPSLVSLGVSAGRLTMAVSPALLEYTVDVGLFATAVTLTPTANLPDATIMVGGALVAGGTPSEPVTLALGANPVTIEVRSSDGVAKRSYTITLDRASTVLQEAYIKASNTGVDDRFYSVSMSGDTLAVGAWSEGSNATGVDGDQTNNLAGTSGAVYVFTRSGTTWTQQAYLKASNTGAGDAFGTSVSLAGDTLAVGAPLEDSSATGVNGDQSNNLLLSSGAVYVFTRSGTTWSQQAYLKAANTGGNDRFGTSVSLSGDTLAVGAPLEASSATGVNPATANDLATNSGAVYAFTRSGTTWSQQAYIKASNTGANDGFGTSVSLSGDVLAVGAPYEDSSATGVNGSQTDDAVAGDGSGAVYVFTRSGTTWSQDAYVKATNTGPSDWFGYSVALVDDTLAVGAPNEDSSATGVNGVEVANDALNSGAVYVLTRGATGWKPQVYLKASNTNANDQFGYSLALTRDALAVGAPYEDQTATTSGATFVFMRDGASWSQRAHVKASNLGAGDGFGYGVALAGDTLAVGAISEDSSATGVNGDQTNDGASFSGAVYIVR